MSPRRARRDDTTKAVGPTPAGTSRAEPFAIDLYQDGDFVSQQNADWCVPAAIQMMIRLASDDADPSVPTQRALNERARQLSTPRLDGAGSEPEGWAGVLNELGHGPYVVEAARTRGAAVEEAARALRQTGRPVGLLIWRGAHAWVMSGFRASADPARTDDFAVTHVSIQDPWHPRVSSIWGPAQPPDSLISVEDLADDYLPWRRPHADYPEKDGRFVLVLPTPVSETSR